MFGGRRQERRAATDDDRIAENAQLVDEAELERLRGQAGAADLDVLVGRFERRGDFLGHRRLGEPGVAPDAVERAAEDDLRERAPDVGERFPELVVAHRRLRLPHQHRLVEPAAQQNGAELAHPREVETEQLLARSRPPERAVAVGDEAVHRGAHRVDQHGFRPSSRSVRRPAMGSTLGPDIRPSLLPRRGPARPPRERTPAISPPWTPNRPPAGCSGCMTASLAMAPLSAKTAVSHPKRARAGRPKRFVVGPATVSPAVRRQGSWRGLGGAQSFSSFIVLSNSLAVPMIVTTMR